MCIDKELAGVLWDEGKEVENESVVEVDEDEVPDLVDLKEWKSRLDSYKSLERSLTSGRDYYKAVSQVGCQLTRTPHSVTDKWA